VSAILIPLAATVAAGGLTYWFCVRPMRGGRGCMPGEGDVTAPSATDFDAQITAARAELDQLHAGRQHEPLSEHRSAGDVQH
jgi:hypothetical protein